MFKKLPEASARKRLALVFEGSLIEAYEGDTVAAAILQHGGGATRTSVVTGGPRAPYCMMGVCFECLMTIDGMVDQQACMVPAKDGMIVQRQFRATELVR